MNILEQKKLTITQIKNQKNFQSKRDKAYRDRDIATHTVYFLKGLARTRQLTDKEKIEYLIKKDKIAKLSQEIENINKILKIERR